MKNTPDLKMHSISDIVADKVVLTFIDQSNTRSILVMSESDFERWMQVGLTRLRTARAARGVTSERPAI